MARLFSLRLFTRFSHRGATTRKEIMNRILKKAATLAATVAAATVVATASAPPASAVYVLTGCQTGFSGNSTYAICGNYDKHGDRIYRYNAFALCQAWWGGDLHYVGGNTVGPYTKSWAYCAWYENAVSAGVNLG